MKKNNPNIKTFREVDSEKIKQLEDDIKQTYHYQKELTEELDSLVGDYDQNIINKIILWKVNRYAKLTKEATDLINQIPQDSETFDKDITRKLLTVILPMRGMRLPMSSAILRFRNSKIYQILDYRVYRVVKGKELFFPQEIDEQIDLYFDYLENLKRICDELSLDYTLADRTLYKLDKETLNSDISLKSYGRFQA